MKNSVTLLEAAEINPSLPKDKLPSPSDQVAFVPMAQVGEDGSITSVETRAFNEVSKGYTQFYENDVLLAKITPCMENGKAAMVSGLSTLVGCGSTEYHVLRAREGTWPRYLFHSVWNEPFRNLAARNMTGSAGQKRVPRSFLESHKIPLPPLEEQKRIAAILDKADAIRRKLQQSLRLSDDFLRSVFLDMFGDPVTNPKGWDDSSVLGEVAEIVSGVTKGRKLDGKKTREIPYLAVANVQDKRLNLEAVKTIPATNDEIQKYRLIKNDLLLTEGGDPDKLGRGTLWNDELAECIHQNHIFRVRVMHPEIHPVFLNWLVGSERGKKYFLRSAKQTTGIASINMTQLRAFPMLIPPMLVQKQFAALIQAVAKKTMKLTLQSHAAENLFSSLQQRAFRGEL